MRPGEPELQRLEAGGDRVMLPFSFSDQCTGWLQVTPTHDGTGLVNVQAGWSGLGQYDFNPSKFIAVGRSLPDFTPVRNARIERALADVIAAVTACRDELASSDRAAPGEHRGWMRRRPPGDPGGRRSALRQQVQSDGTM